MATLNVIYKIAADISALQSGVDRAATSTEKLASMAGTVGKALTAAFTVAGVEQIASKFLEVAGHLTDLSQKTGISTTGLQKLDLAFQQSGVSLDTVTGSIAKLSKNLIGGDKTAIGAMEKLGLSIKDLKALGPDEMFIKVADKIGGIANPTEKAYAAMAIFGKGGVELLQGLDGHLAETTKHFEDMGLIIDEKTIKAADDFGDQLGLMGKQLLGIVASIIGPLLPALSALGTALMTIGSVIGPVVGFAMKGVTIAVAGLWEGIALLLSRLIDLAQSVPLVGKYLGGLTEASGWLQKSAMSTATFVEKLALGTDAVGESAKKATPPLIGLGELPDGPLKSLLHNLDEMVAKLTPLPGHLVLVSAQVKVFGEAAMKLVEEAAAMGVTAPASVRKIAAAWNDIEVAKVVAKVTETWTKDLIKFNEEGLKTLEAGSKRMGDAIINNFALAQAAQSHATDLIDERTLSSFDLQRRGVEKWVREHKAAVDTAAGNAQAAFDAIDKAGVEAFTNITDAETRAMALDFTGPINQATGFADGVDKITAAFAQLAQVSGAAFGGLVKDIAQVLAAMEVGAKSAVTFKTAMHPDADGKRDWAGAATGVIGMVGAMDQATSSTTQWKATLGGAATGMKIGAKIAGPYGAAVGAAAGALIGFFRSAGAAERAINPLREQFVQSAGGLAALNQQAHEAGLTLDHLLQAKNAAQYKTAIEELTVAFAAHKAQVDANNTALGNLITAGESLGMRIPEGMKPAIQSLIDMKLITGDAAAAFGVLAGNTDVDFKHMQETAEKYGIDLAALGPQFESARLHDSAKTIINDFEMLTANGANVDGVLAGMKDEIGHLVEDSIKFGVAIPENMRPWIEQLSKTHQLIGENGQEITDLSGLQFAPPIVSEFDKIVAKLQELIDKISGPTGVTSLINAIPTNKTIHVGFQYDPYDPPNHAEGVATGGLVTAHGIQHFAGGGNVLPFRPLGTDTVPAMLTPGELVLTRAQQRAVFGRGGGPATVVDFSGLRQDLAGLRQDLADDRRLLAKRIRDVVRGAA